MIAFLIPMRHEESVPDYDKTWALLNQSLLSLAKQDNIHWHAIICANKVLPVSRELPQRKFTFIEYKRDYVCRHILARQWKRSQHEFEQHLIDKAVRRQVAAKFALRALSPQWFFMMDADDLVSSKLVSSLYMVSQIHYLFMYVNAGIVLNTEKQTYRSVEDFNRLCGTSVAIRPSVVRERIDSIPELVTVFGHHYNNYQRSCSTHHQRYFINHLPLVAYVQHDHNHGRDIWSHWDFEGEEISSEMRQEFQIPDVIG